MCESLFLFVYRETESEKCTSTHQYCFWMTGTGVQSSIFFFILLHALQNCLHLLQETCTILIIFKNNVMRKRKKSLQKVVKWGKQIITLWSTIPVLSPTPKTIWLIFYWLKKTQPSLSDITNRELLCVPGF